MKTKKKCYSEAAYLFGLVLLAVGTALMEKANFGMSMVVAPAYLLHLKLSQTFPWFSFGMAEYVLQAVLLLIMGLILRSFKKGYLGSFVTAVIYGLILDRAMSLAGLLPGEGMAGRVVFYLLGMAVCSVGIAFLFHTYLPPEAYELLVKELTVKYGWKLSTVKRTYDCISCAIAILLSFLFFGFGHFEGVRLGTIFCALVNGSMIGWCSRWMDSAFIFEDRFYREKCL